MSFFEIKLILLHLRRTRPGPQFQASKNVHRENMDICHLSNFCRPGTFIEGKNSPLAEFPLSKNLRSKLTLKSKTILGNT